MHTIIFNEKGELRSGWKALGFILLALTLGKGFNELAKHIHPLGALAQRGVSGPE